MDNDLHEQASLLRSEPPEKQPDQDATSPLAGGQVRRLCESDRPLLEDFLATGRGYSLFLSANLVYLQSNRDLVRYWGAYVGQHLAAVLMMVGGRAMIYAEPGIDLSLLARISV